MTLREYDTETLRRELRARETCVDCRTDIGIVWYPAGLHRIRCHACHVALDHRQPSLFHEASA